MPSTPRRLPSGSWNCYAYLGKDAEGMADAVATITANLIEGKDKFEGLNENYEVVDGWTVNIPYSVYTGE